MPREVRSIFDLPEYKRIKLEREALVNEEKKKDPLTLPIPERVRRIEVILGIESRQP